MYICIYIYIHIKNKIKFSEKRNFSFSERALWSVGMSDSVLFFFRNLDLGFGMKAESAAVRPHFVLLLSLKSYLADNFQIIKNI